MYLNFPINDIFASNIFVLVFLNFFLIYDQKGEKVINSYWTKSQTFFKQKYKVIFSEVCR